MECDPPCNADQQRPAAFNKALHDVPAVLVAAGVLGMLVCFAVLPSSLQIATDTIWPVTEIFPVT